MTIQLETTECLQWLQDVHKVPALEYRIAQLEGNEDSPTEVRLYAKDHYKCKPTIYRFDPDTSTLVLFKFGQKPQLKFIEDRPATPNHIKEN